MKDRNSTPASIAKEKLQYECDKAFDESMLSLTEWLIMAHSKQFLDWEKVLDIFKEELKSRRNHDC